MRGSSATLRHKHSGHLQWCPGDASSSCGGGPGDCAQPQTSTATATTGTELRHSFCESNEVHEQACVAACADSAKIHQSKGQATKGTLHPVQGRPSNSKGDWGGRQKHVTPYCNAGEHKPQDQRPLAECIRLASPVAASHRKLPT
jgi:hypothetical protein